VSARRFLLAMLSGTCRSGRRLLEHAAAMLDTVQGLRLATPEGYN